MTAVFLQTLTPDHTQISLNPPFWRHEAAALLHSSRTNKQFMQKTDMQKKEKWLDFKWPLSVLKAGHMSRHRPQLYPDGIHPVVFDSSHTETKVRQLNRQHACAECQRATRSEIWVLLVNRGHMLLQWGLKMINEIRVRIVTVLLNAQMLQSSFVTTQNYLHVRICPCSGYCHLNVVRRNVYIL